MCRRASRCRCGCASLPDRRPGSILGAVLAGGASSRFGSDKAAAVLGERTLLDHARAALSEVVEEIVIVGRDGGVPDLPIAGLGPLGGIAGALGHAAGRGFASVLTIACDMPAMPEELLALLLARAPTYCADAPVLGHWPTALAGALIDRLAHHAPSPRTCSGAPAAEKPDADVAAAPWMPGRPRQDGGKHQHLSVRRWAAEIGALPIPSPAPLRNINTPADLATA